MEFQGKRRNRNVRKTEYASNLQLYKVPPVETISLQEFEELAEQRLKLLTEIDRIHQKSKHEGVHKGDDDYKRKMEVVTKKWMPLSAVYDEGLTIKHIEERRRDHISHYILRLAYCRTADMRRWLLSQETELLRFRYLTSNKQDKEEFFLCYKDDFNMESIEIPLPDAPCWDNEEDPILKKVSRQVSKEVYSFYGGGHNVTVGEDNELHVQTLGFFKVPFLSALDLVQTRQVVLKQGFIYVPTNSPLIVSLVCSKFRSRLSEELTKTLHNLAVVDDDERIAPLVKTLKNRYLGEDFSNAGTQFAGAIKVSQLDSLSKESFPSCMRHLHESLRRDHHLKHFARLQYGLFLKNIGLTLEQALAFWRAEFTKKMDVDKFEKGYAYNVRHSYGKEGKRANYTAYSCMKIIMSNAPGQGDHHGCPFRHWDQENLRRMLTSHGISQKGVTEVLSYAGNSHYQLACQKHFEITHSLPSTQFSLEHPVQYFIESRKVRGGPIDTHVKQEDNQHQPPPPPSSSTDTPSHSAGPPPLAESGDQATNGMEFGDVSELDLEGGFDDNDDNMDCN